MQTRRLNTCLLICSITAVASHANEQTPLPASPESPSHQCDAESSENLPHCKSIEVIEVTGRYIGIEVPEVIGRAYLDSKFIEATPKGNGDINELVALLPGVQLSSDALLIDNLQEISAPEISISGAQPWQTAFSLDGMNYNNRIDPGESSRIKASANDVSGGVQTMNINSDIVDSITVYDHNIPAQYGGFSGGVVDAQTKSPFLDDTSFNFGVRANQSDWGRYHVIEPSDEGTGNETIQDNELTPPIFEKGSYSLNAQTKLNEHHALMFSMNALRSTISDISLAQVQTQRRDNINSLIKYGYRDGWVDKLDLSFLYSPYKDTTYLKNVRNSHYVIEGGNSGIIANLVENTNFGQWQMQLNISHSDSSREAPEHYYIWRQAKGKEWGQFAEQSVDDLPVSLEGGHGNIDKNQTSYALNNNLDFHAFTIGASEHALSVGTQITRQEVERTRHQDSYNYNAPVLWASDTAQLNCSGYTLDCIERALYVDLETLAQQLGGSINFNNPDHVLAYSNNIATTAQYFSGRAVTPQEHISVALQQAALFATNKIEWGDWQLNLGLRYEYDDFLKNHNLAPRFSAGYHLFSDTNTLLTIGLNRYYDASIIGYKLREHQRFSYQQYRPIRNGYVQNWLDSNYTGQYRYRFDNVHTPYDDEVAVGLKHATQHVGTFSFNYVHRNKRQQFSRNNDAPIAADGYRYIYMTNEGTGQSQRYSIAWSAQFGAHSLWANASYSDNEISNESYTASAINTPLDELVFYDDGKSTQPVSLSELTRIRTNFGTPVTAALGWNVDWSRHFNTSLSATYSGSYDTAVKADYQRPLTLNVECADCELDSVFTDVYKKRTIKERVMLNLSARWQIPLSHMQQLELRADVSNLLNARSYLIDEGESGIEPGRMFWLGVTYYYE